MTGIEGWSGKTVLIVGGSGGMGRAVAHEFEKAGASIAIAYINTKNLPEQFLAIKGDITKVSDCAGMISKTVAHFGRLDVLVNAAGVWVEGESAAMSEAQWDRTIDINLKGTFFTCRHAIPELEKIQGQIINIASDAVLLEMPVPPSTAPQRVALCSSPRPWPLNLRQRESASMPFAPAMWKRPCWNSRLGNSAAATRKPISQN